MQASLEEFDREVEGWLPLLPETSLPQLTSQMLADVIRRKGATAGSLDGSGWRELKVLPVAWFDGLASVLSKVEEKVGSGPMVCWMLLLPSFLGLMEMLHLLVSGLSVFSRLCTGFGLLPVWFSLRVGFGHGSKPRFLVLVVAAGRGH